MQIQEKDVENALIKAFQTGFSGLSFEVLGQQIPCSVGIIDVMAFLRQGYPEHYIDYLWVCEVKRGPAPDSAIAQLLAYCHLVQWYLHDQYPGIEGVSAGNADFHLYPWPVIVAESLGKMGQKAHAAGVIHFVRYTYQGLGAFKFDYMRDYGEDKKPYLGVDLEPFVAKSLKAIYNDPANWSLFHDRQLQEKPFTIPPIWKARVKG